MRDYFLTFFVAFLACTDAQYFYPEPQIVLPVTSLPEEYLPPVTTPSAEYLPPVTTQRTTTTTEEAAYEPDSDTLDEQILIPVAVTTAKPTTTTEHEHHHHDVPFWDFRESIPGEPEEDYPILDKIPSTEFKCNNRLDGYYADLETRCQVFHICSKQPDGAYIQSSFLCPNGTMFQQESFACQWWADVACASSAKFYELNSKIGVVPGSDA